MPVESGDFQALVATFDSDEHWDKSNPLEKGYAAAGLKRYNLDNIWRSYAEVTFEEKEKEELTATKGSNSASSQNIVALALGDGPGDGGDPCKVKKENPLHDTLKEQLPYLKTGKSVCLILVLAHALQSHDKVFSLWNIFQTHVITHMNIHSLRWHGEVVQ